MGKKKALVAVGHSILVIIYHVLKRKERYRELGGIISTAITLGRPNAVG
jgi:hypothetical protein